MSVIVPDLAGDGLVFSCVANVFRVTDRSTTSIITPRVCANILALAHDAARDDTLLVCAMVNVIVVSGSSTRPLTAPSTCLMPMSVGVIESTSVILVACFTEDYHAFILAINGTNTTTLLRIPSAPESYLTLQLYVTTDEVVHLTNGFGLTRIIDGALQTVFTLGSCDKVSNIAVIDSILYASCRLGGILSIPVNVSTPAAVPWSCRWINVHPHTASMVIRRQCGCSSIVAIVS
jgi:hypothetical protein